MDDPTEGKDKNPHHGHHADDHPIYNPGNHTGQGAGHPELQNIYPSPTAGIGREDAPAPDPASVAPADGAAIGANPKPQAADPAHNTHDGLHILQWLTFMFWGLTILALAFLTGSVFERLIAGTDTYTFNYYVISSLIILLPLAFICDVIYAKREPEKKTGLSSRIMAAYSVIFALFGIFALLGIAWNIVGWATAGGGDSSSSIADIVSGVFIFFYYLASFMRTLNPVRLSWITTAYRFTVLGLVLIFVVLGFTKPTFNSNAASASSNNSSGSTYSSGGGNFSSTSSAPDSSGNNYGPGGRLQPAVVGGTQCDIPTLSDGSTTGQVALAGGATCAEAETDIYAANGHNGGHYTATGGYYCTSTKQGADTQWSSYWNDNFYSYNCTSGSKQVAFNLQTKAQSESR